MGMVENEVFIFSFPWECCLASMYQSCMWPAGTPENSFYHKSWLIPAHATVESLVAAALDPCLRTDRLGVHEDRGMFIFTILLCF